LGGNTYAEKMSNGGQNIALIDKLIYANTPKTFVGKEKEKRNSLDVLIYNAAVPSAGGRFKTLSVVSSDDDKTIFSNTEFFEEGKERL